jgi:hypothetical protein
MVDGSVESLLGIPSRDLAVCWSLELWIDSYVMLFGCVVSSWAYIVILHIVTFSMSRPARPAYLDLPYFPSESSSRRMQSLLPIDFP